MILARLDSLDRHLEFQNGRSSKLENWRSYLTGGFAVLAGVVTWVLGR